MEKIVMPSTPPVYQSPVQRVLSELERVKQSSPGKWVASCPVSTHGKGRRDRHPSLSITETDDGKVLLLCHAGCDVEDIVAAIDLEMKDLFPKTTEVRSIPSQSAAPLHHTGCTLEAYARAKQLPLDFLRELGLTQYTYQSTPAVRIPYRDRDGAETAVRYRIGLEGTGERFRWTKGSKVTLYGLDRLNSYEREPAILLVEGESDAQTALYHGIPAIGLPGAGNWKEDRDAEKFDGFERIDIIIEPDSGGEAVKRWLASSSIRDRAYLVSLAPYKDLSDLHLHSDDFARDWADALANAQPWTDLERKEAEREQTEAWEQCAELATMPNILDGVADFLEERGVVGERRVLKLLYLILTSRLLPRPINASLKGPSSSGKSYVLQSVLDLFPAEAYYSLSGMSERALIYDDRPLVHRYVIVYEAVGVSGEHASY